MARGGFVVGDAEGAGAGSTSAHLFEARFGEFVSKAVVDGCVFADGGATTVMVAAVAASESGDRLTAVCLQLSGTAAVPMVIVGGFVLGRSWEVLSRTLFNSTGY